MPARDTDRQGLKTLYSRIAEYRVVNRARGPASSTIDSQVLEVDLCAAVPRHDIELRSVY